METYLKNDPRQWHAVQNDSKEVEFGSYNDQAMDTLLRGMLDPEVAKIIHLSCTTAKEVWDNLGIIHKGAPIRSGSESLYNARPWYRAGWPNRPPIFLGSENYILWKFRIRFFLKRDAGVWNAVENGYIVPKHKDGTFKDYEEFTGEEANLYLSNNRAMNILLCGIPDSELSMICSRTTAKEIWDGLRIVHEGTPEIQKIKLRGLIPEYYRFQLGENESINQAEARFVTLLNSLAQSGKRIPQSEINWHVLGIMPERFLPIVTALEHSSTICTMHIFTLFGKLKGYEGKLKRYEEERKAKKICRKKTFDLDSDEEDQC